MWRSKLHLLGLTILFILIFMGIQCGRKKTGRAFSPEKKISWHYNLETAQKAAREQQKIVMIDFTAEWCPPCQLMEDSTFSDARIIQQSQWLIPVRIDVDRQPEISVKYNGNARKYGGVGIPNILFLSPQDQRLRHLIGFTPPEHLHAVMDSLLKIYSFTE